jgi:predicted kinase
MVGKDPNLVIINADSIGQMLKGTYARYSDDGENFKVMRGLVATIVQDAAKRAIDGGFNFIIDETLRTQESREKWIKLIHFYCGQTFKYYKITVVVFPEIDIETSLKNRMKNPKGVSRRKWKEIISRMHNTWEPCYYRELDKSVDVIRFETRRDIIKFLKGHNECHG